MTPHLNSLLELPVLYGRAATSYRGTKEMSHAVLAVLFAPIYLGGNLLFQTVTEYGLACSALTDGTALDRV